MPVMLSVVVIFVRSLVLICILIHLYFYFIISNNTQLLYNNNFKLFLQDKVYNKETWVSYTNNHVQSGLYQPLNHLLLRNRPKLAVSVLRYKINQKIVICFSWQSFHRGCRWVNKLGFTRSCYFVYFMHLSSILQSR